MHGKIFFVSLSHFLCDPLYFSFVTIPIMPLPSPPSLLSSHFISCHLISSPLPCFFHLSSVLISTLLHPSHLITLHLFSLSHLFSRTLFIFILTILLIPESVLPGPRSSLSDSQLQVAIVAVFAVVVPVL